MSELQTVIDTLDHAADSFDGIATAEQKKIYSEVLTLAKDLDTDAQGKVKQSIANLKRLTQIKAKLAALSKDKEWVAGITQFAQYFGILQQQQNAYYTAHFPSLTLSTAAKQKHQLMKQLAVQNTMEALMGSGLKANVTDKLNDILLRAVTTNAKFSDLQEELRAHLLGKDGRQGAFARYATTYATTALSQFTGQNNKLLTDDLDCEWFMYVGSNKETTREFCSHLTAKKFVHRSEIPDLLKGKIDDYQCAIYPKTGLPYGMIEGTTPDNFQCNCGGWNCRHQLIPVADAVVPANLRAKFSKKNTISSASEIKTSDPQEVAQRPTRTEQQIEDIRLKWMMRQMRNTNLTNDERSAIALNNIEIEKAIGIPKGKPMTIEQADKQSANPKHKLPYIKDQNGKLVKNPNYNKGDKQYSINCATCAACYVLRLRGFDLTAKGNVENSNSLNEQLSRGKSFDVWKNIDGSPCSPNTYMNFMSKYGYKRMTPLRYKNFFEESCTEDGVYIVTIGWKGGGGHATIIERVHGKLYYIEPQNYNVSKGAMRDIMELCNEGDATPHYRRGILRVDNKVFDSAWKDLFDKTIN